MPRPTRRIALIALALTAILSAAVVGALALTPISSSPAPIILSSQQTENFQIAIYPHENGSFELGLQHLECVDYIHCDWGEIQLPEWRFLPSNAPPGRWYTTSSISLVIKHRETRGITEARPCVPPRGDYCFYGGAGGWANVDISPVPRSFRIFVTSPNPSCTINLSSGYKASRLDYPAIAMIAPLDDSTWFYGGQYVSAHAQPPERQPGGIFIGTGSIIYVTASEQCSEWLLVIDEIPKIEATTIERG